MAYFQVLPFAFIIGGNTAAGALIAAIVMVLGVNLIRAHSPLPTDTSIGVLFVGFLALGVVIMSSQTGSYVGDLSRFLFGSITGVEAEDLVRQGVAAVITVGGAPDLLSRLSGSHIRRNAGSAPGFATQADPRGIARPDCHCRGRFV